MTANGQDGPIDVLPGTSVTYAWQVTTDFYYPMGATVTDDTYTKLNGSCYFSVFPATPCGLSFKVIVSTLGPVTNTAHVEAVNSCFMCPVSTAEDTVIVNVVTATPTLPPTSPPTAPPAVGGAGIEPRARTLGGASFLVWLLLLVAAGALVATALAARCAVRR